MHLILVKTLFMCYLHAHMGQISVLLCMRVHVCACVCVGCRNTQCIRFFSLLGHTMHGSIVLGFPANHMSGLLMSLPSYINQM